MYHHCIFCSADLGANEVLPTFPVGRRVAFDAWKGRLWVVCPACTRWNLSPLEERWEAVEEAERLFRDARMRVQSENVGLAHLPEGTRLIRVGKALAGELAAWRYGGQLVQRRRRYQVLVGAGVAGAAVVGGLALAGVVSVTGGGWWIVATILEHRGQRRVIHRLAETESPTGKVELIRRWHVEAATLEEMGDDGVGLVLPDVSRTDPRTTIAGDPKYTGETLALQGRTARAVLARAMVHVNRKGASRTHVEDAVKVLAEARSAEDFLRTLSRDRRALGRRMDRPETELGQERALALEMALHEESERRALQGELASLEAAWREAEEIAAIADDLLSTSLNRIRARLPGL